MTCPKCGAQNMDGVTFCGSCGAQMTFQTPPLPEEPQQNWQQPYQQPQQQPVYGNSPSGSGYQGANTPSGNPSNGGMVPPKNYMTEAILVTVISFLCCCSSPISIILGIIAIVKANSVNSAFAGGNYNEAISSADSAKKLTIWAAVIAVIWLIIFSIAYALFFAAIINEAGGLQEIINAR